MDNQRKFNGFSRRRFLSQALPACSLLCLGAGSGVLGFSPALKKAFQKAKHKFDEELPMKLTGRQLMAFTYGRDYIPLLKLLSEEIGKDTLIAILKKHSANQGTQVGRMMAKQFGKNDFATLKKIFSPDSPNFKNSLTLTITEDTDAVHELKVTECIWADAFLQSKAGELGEAAICHGDYAMATAFNPKIEMVRDKTLMQGHDCCNHRYLLKT
ncbi:MAG: L-2-amino-thiazoline-4-carboxylic acid hydrolase [Candidatus Aminicenantes bacterium]|nr:L-2-amino-thiazoline-4-carboxylic acid hydrolase [Candidatus Aminicenantes bacterium]